MATVKTIFDGAVSGEKEIVIDITQAQAKELRDALEIVQDYEEQALKAAKVSKKESDWVMVSYAVKNDKVIIRVKDGACG